jgi:hypothetical protein
MELGNATALSPSAPEFYPSPCTSVKAGRESRLAGHAPAADTPQTTARLRPIKTRPSREHDVVSFLDSGRAERNLQMLWIASFTLPRPVKPLATGPRCQSLPVHLTPPRPIAPHAVCFTPSQGIATPSTQESWGHEGMRSAPFIYPPPLQYHHMPMAGSPMGYMGGPPYAASGLAPSPYNLAAYYPSPFVRRVSRLSLTGDYDAPKTAQKPAAVPLDDDDVKTPLPPSNEAAAWAARGMRALGIDDVEVPSEVSVVSL